MTDPSSSRIRNDPPGQHCSISQLETTYEPQQHATASAASMVAALQQQQQHLAVVAPLAAYDDNSSLGRFGHLLDPELLQVQIHHCLHGLAETNIAVQQLLSPNISPEQSLRIAANVLQMGVEMDMAHKSMQFQQQIVHPQQEYHSERRHQQSLQAQRENAKWRTDLDTWYREMVQYTLHTAKWLVSILILYAAFQHVGPMIQDFYASPLRFIGQQMGDSFKCNAAATANAQQQQQHDDNHHHHHHHHQAPPNTTMGSTQDSSTWFGMSSSTLWSVLTSSSSSSSSKNTFVETISHKLYMAIDDLLVWAYLQFGCAGGIFFMYSIYVAIAISFGWTVQRIPVVRNYVSPWDGLAAMAFAVQYNSVAWDQAVYIVAVVGIPIAILLVYLWHWHGQAKAKLLSMVETTSSSSKSNPSITDTEALRDDLDAIKFGLSMAKVLFMIGILLHWCVTTTTYDMH